VLKNAAPDFALTRADLQRVCRDLAWSELAGMPSVKSALGARVPLTEASATLDWSANRLDLDSLSRMQMATAAATWCNAYDSGFEDLFLAKRSAADWAEVMARARAAGAAHFTFSSSGSTGTSKHLRHREEVLWAEAQAWAQVLRSKQDGSEDALRCAVSRVVVLVPTHHIYGFIWGVLLPQALGVPAVDAALENMPALSEGDLVIAVPDQWDWLAASARANWPAQLRGVSSTAPLSAATHRRLTEEPHGLQRLMQIYGSTETAGLAHRSSAERPYTLAPERSRNAQDGISLRLPDGESVALDVQDHLDWVSASEFHVLRRTDDSVQVGGHNVSPAWVAAQLRSVAGVKDAAVRLDLMSRPQRLKAFVVPSAPEQSESMRLELAAWAADALPWYANFSSITTGPELPKNALGKPSDWQVT
jgi:long-chain acyl-CoA synthetase